MRYTYRKSEGEDVWTVGRETLYEAGETWVPESDWESEELAIRRVAILDLGLVEPPLITDLRKAVEEMMNSYRLEGKERKNDAYWRGAADACGNILDMPEMKLFLKEQQ